MSITMGTWKVLDELRRETGISKRRLVELAVRHLAGCEDAQTALSALGYDAESIVNIIRDLKLGEWDSNILVEPA